MSEAEATDDAAAPAGPTKNPEVAALKSRIASLKSERQAALEAGDRGKLKVARRRISRLKRKIRKVS